MKAPRFAASFHALPIETQDEILGELYGAILYRGRDRGHTGINRSPKAVEVIQKITDIMHNATGVDFEEYT